MKSSTGMCFKLGVRRRSFLVRRAAVAVVTCLLCVATAWYCTARGHSTPVIADASSGPELAVAERLMQQPSTTTTTTSSAFSPFLYLVPWQDGTGLDIGVGGTGQLGGIVYADVTIGPGHHKGGWTSIYSDTIQAYVIEVVGFTPREGIAGSVQITTTSGLDAGAVAFDRVHVPAFASQSIFSPDGNLELKLVSKDTIPYETYVAVVPSYGPPGPAPLGHRLVGSTYSVRAAGALLVADRPMLLQLAYDELMLAGIDPHTLAILAWDAGSRRWDNLIGRLSYDRRTLSVATQRFRPFSLAATLSWRDEFDDDSGLDEWSNVVQGGTPGERSLVLASTETVGSAVSKSISPTTAFAGWGSLTYSHMVDPPTTTLTVDVLSTDGITVLSDVASGTDLSDLDPASYPALRLRAVLCSTEAGETPALHKWQLAWRPPEQRAYLPIVVR